MKVAFATAAASLALMVSAPSQAAIYTGFLAGDFFSVFLEAPLFESRALRIKFEADLTKVEDAFLTIVYDVGFQGTDDAGPGQPRQVYGDFYDIAEDFSWALTPTGFSVLIDTDDNSACDPYKGPDYFCEYEWLNGFVLDGSVIGTEHVAYRYEITAVPEPASWALIIAGFGVAGGILRRAKFATRAVTN